ncbi:alpha/beta fold hydrolase [Piscinibacter sakaiensis]|uniref:alpha/beta fold hydrolase n=1 Tax=Piscinibacter sakaiensis TaxID=1547922 RepID=UPI003AAF29C9
MALELNCESTGNGPPLLLLHGLFGSATNWRGIAKALADSHEVFALDLRNHGASPWADSMDYDDLADDVFAFITSRKLAPAAVLGHSMGGKAAMALALRHPDAVGRLIVADIAPVAYKDSLTPYAEAMRGIDVMAAASRTEVQRRLQERLPDPSVAGFLAQNLVSRNDHFDWRINLAVIIAEMHKLSGFPAALRELRYENPVTVIAGARSSYVEHHDGRDFAPMFSDVTVEVIDEAGHWLHADRPQQFVAIVRRALAGEAR